MSNEESDYREQIARARSGEVLKEDLESFVSPLTVLASPAWRGIEGDIWRATTCSQSIILKHFHSDTNFYVDTNAAIVGTEQAGLLGIGPEVLDQWPSDSMFAMADLGSYWRAGGLQDARDPVIRNNVIAQKKAFQSKASLSRKSSIFDEIETMYALASETSWFTHIDIEIFASFFQEAHQKLRAQGMDIVPCHRDGNTANLMIGPDNAVNLLDFDLAANSDPFEDIGCYLVEFFESDADARAGFEEWHGGFDEGLFQRAMIYGLADDMRWGLIGSIMTATSSRSALEFSKYAAWRFLRLEAHIKRSDANSRIRMAK